MRSIRNLSAVPAGSAIASDDLLEYHAARILLLLLICGANDVASRRRRIDGLTKLAKLDFFARYPDFFYRIARELGQHVELQPVTPEAKMVRYHYGPWDKRYYQVLPYLEARGLLEVKKDATRNQFLFYLTPAGQTIASDLKAKPQFSKLASHMARIKSVVGGKSGNQLKNMIYKTFDREVANLRLGEVIE